VKEAHSVLLLMEFDELNNLDGAKLIIDLLEANLITASKSKDETIRN